MINEKVKGISALEGKGFLLRKLNDNEMKEQEKDMTGFVADLLIHTGLHNPHHIMSGRCYSDIFQS